MLTIWMRMPETIEAVQFDGKNFDEIREFTKKYFISADKGSVTIKCGDSSSEYELDVIPGWYIVKDNSNADYPFSVMTGNTLNTRYAPDRKSVV